MKLVVLVLLAACNSGAGNDFPIGPGGGGGIIIGGTSPPGGGSGDAGVGDGGDGDAGIPTSGRVCLLTDLRRIGDPAACSMTGADDLVVALGGHTATTAVDGTFTILAPLGSGLSWQVTGGAHTPTNLITPSVMPFGTDNTIPAIVATQYLDLLHGNGSVLSDLQGSIFVRVVNGVTGVASVTATSPDATDPTLYDGAVNGTSWGQNLTGKFGIVWLPAVSIPVPAGPTKVTLVTQAVTLATASVTVEDQAITFLTQDVSRTLPAQ
jgi:hypothetical protein